MSQYVLIFYAIAQIFFHSSLTSISFKSVASYFYATEQEPLENQEFPVNSGVTVQINAIDGDIIIKPWKSNHVLVSGIKYGTQEQLSSTNVQIDHTQQVFTIKTMRNATTTTSARINYTIMVPENSSLKASVVNGSIKIKQCEATIKQQGKALSIAGPINLKTQKGDISIKNAAKGISATTDSGTIKVTLNHFSPQAWAFLETHYGDVLLTVSKNINAELHAKTVQGRITSTLPITLEPRTTTLDKYSWKKLQQDINGTLGRGGAPITIDVTHGNIQVQTA